MRVIGSMWKFKLKRDSNGNVSKFKARLVARGDMQDPDWGSVFAPAVRYTSLRVILAIACHQDFEIEQMDVVTTFLNADVELDIYMEQPQGFVVLSPSGDRLICHLRKVLYGIRKAPRAWNALLTSWLISRGFKQSLVDPGVFTIYYESLLYILAVYVDDSILVGKAGKFIYRFKLDLSNRF